MENPRCAQCVSCRIGGGVSVTLDLGLGAPSKGALYRAYRGREGDVVAQATNWTSTVDYGIVKRGLRVGVTWRPILLDAHLLTYGNCSCVCIWG